MEIIDTNVLVRLLIDNKDAVEQTQLARQFLKRVKQVYITQIVQVETIWVLERAYKIPKDKLISILKCLHESKIFILQSEHCFYQALMLFQHVNVGFSDCLIVAETNLKNKKLFTFDKRLSRLEYCQLLIS